jgi:hypothetical protein
MQMLRAKCAAGCGDFDVVSLPMPAELATKTMMARGACPWCGARAGNMMASPRPLTPEEIVIKQGALERDARRREMTNG